MQSVNGAQFLNITPLFLLSARLASTNCAAFFGTSGSGSSPASPVIVMVPFTCIYVCYNHVDLTLRL